MAEDKVLQILLSGVSKWNHWRSSHPEITYAYLDGVSLRGVNLAGADLRGVLFYNTDLSGADLSGADLCGAHLPGAKLQGTKLQGAIYDKSTMWPEEFNPKKAGVIFKKRKKSKE